MERFRGISPIIVAVGLVVLALLVDLTLGAIKYVGFWSTLSINVFDYLAFWDLLRSSGVPWLCSLAFGLFLRATIVLPGREKNASVPMSNIFQNAWSRKLAAFALLASPFLLYSIIIVNLPNHGMLARSPFFFVFLLCLYVVIRVGGISINFRRAIAISLATFCMMALTEATIARKKACDRVSGFDAVHIGKLRDYSFEFESQANGANAVAIYEIDSDKLLSRTENVTPKCPQYPKRASR